MDNDIPIAPQNFDYVERYVSNLPVERVNYLKNIATRYIDSYSDLKELRELEYEETIIVELAGYLLELTN